MGFGRMNISWTETILALVAGLVLFLYGVNRLSDDLREMAGDRMKQVLERMTRNPIFGLIAGCIATIILDSSSLTIILVIALVHAGALTFQNSLAVILGSNIGTTLSTQIYAFEIDRYSPVVLAIGLLMLLLGKGKRIEGHGAVVFSIGLVFWGLHQMGEVMKPLAQSPDFTAWLKRLEDPITGALFGAVATVVIQSSSAMMGIVVKSAAAGLVNLGAGVAVMLGAEVGTCADTLLASVGRSREALRAGVFHLCFNVITVCLGLVFYRQIAAIAMWLPNGGDVSRQIANAHMFFNAAGALLFLPLLPLAAKVLCSVIRERRDTAAPQPVEQPEMA